MKKYLFTAVFFYSLSLFAQQGKIDSLHILLKNNSEDTNKVINLTHLAMDMRIKNIDTSFIIVADALNLSKKLNYKTGTGNSYSTLGELYWRKGELNTALDYHNKALKVFEELKDKTRIGKCYSNIGIIYRNRADYKTALEYFLKSEIIAQEIGDSIYIAVNCNNIGIVYDNMSDYTKALEYYLKASEWFEKIQHKQGMASSYSNIGIMYRLSGKYDLANKFYLLALKSFEELGDKTGIGRIYGNIGRIYESKKDYKKALQYDFLSLKFRLEKGNKNELSNSYYNLASIYNLLNKNDSAIYFLNKTITLATEIEAKAVVSDAYQGLYTVYEKQGDYKNAYKYCLLYLQIKDSIFNEESQNQITEMQTKYETEKKELQIENLNKDNAIKETEIKKQNLQKLAFASGFALMLLLAFVIFRGYRQKHKANEIITAQKLEVERQKKVVDEKNMSLSVAYTKIEEKNNEILDSIKYAKRIQEAILPPRKLVKQHLEQSFILYKPKDIVAGDFYWMETSPGKVLFASVDCTGHGVPGAFMSILGFNGLNRCVKEFGLIKPAAILDKLCELVDEAFSKSEADIKDGMDIALCCYDHENNTMEFSGAGNSLYHIREKKLIEIKADKQPIGKFANRHAFTNHNIQLKKNDAIYVFTDGFADQFGGPKGKKFKYKPLENLLLSIQDKQMAEQREFLNSTIEKWKGELEQIDDICIIGVKV